MNISIGIPAYNEASNIKKLLLSILAQEQVGFNVCEIIVVSDASTDHTVEEVNSVESDRIKLIRHSERQGKAFGLNDILQHFEGDVLIILDADVDLGAATFIQNLVEGLNRNAGWTLASCKGVPVKSKSVIGKLLNFSVQLKNDLYDSVNGGNNIHHCHGFCLIFSRKFAKSLLYPKIVSEDAYTFLKNEEGGGVFQYIPQAQLYFKTPENLRDYLNQSRRYMLGDKEFTKYFSEQLINKSYNIGLRSFVKTAITSFFKRPIYFSASLIGYTFLFTISVAVNMFGAASYMWTSPTSSKVVQK